MVVEVVVVPAGASVVEVVVVVAVVVVEGMVVVEVLVVVDVLVGEVTVVGGTLVVVVVEDGSTSDGTQSSRRWIRVARSLSSSFRTKMSTSGNVMLERVR
jgi:hypothetical protein